MAQTTDMSQHFSGWQLVRYTIPSIGMMIFTSIYGVVDGFFVSNFIGEIALASINFVYPIPMILATVGFMLGTGGSAIVAKTRGEGNDQRANQLFSLFVYAAIVSSIACGGIGLAILRPALDAMGATGAMMDGCITYGTIMLAGLPAIVLQYAFQAFVMTAGKPKLGLVITVAAGVTNMALDALFIGVFGWGVPGAAVASIIGQAVGGFVPLGYFARPASSPLRLGRTTLDWRAIGQACFNGLSEMVSSISLSVVSIVYNIQLVRLLGEAGIAAYGVIMYVSFVFLAAFIGYSMGVSPLISFQYGAQNRTELNSLLVRSVRIIAAFGIGMFAATRVLAYPLANLFVSYDQDLWNLTVHAFLLYSAAFLIMGFNIFGSSLFTALGNGLASAIISFVRTMVFEIGAVLLLPLVMGPDGIWVSVFVAEVASLALTTAFLVSLNPRYGYFKR